MRTASASIVGILALGVTNFAVFAGAATVPAQSQVLPHSTAIPVRFEHSVDTKKAKVGDEVTAKTMQVIALPSGRSIPKGAVVVGHVVALEAFHFDQTPYAHQKPSMLSIHFAKLQVGDNSIPVNLSVRAIASTIDSEQASKPHYLDETDRVGTITLIGGTEFTPFDKMIQSDDGDAIGYNRKNGVFARLLASGYCGGTDTEQSIAIFSPDACGAYGFAGDYLSRSGQDGSGTFTLSVRGRSVKIYAGSTALLQVNDAK
jgi:hypothetical protein